MFDRFAEIDFASIFKRIHLRVFPGILHFLRLLAIENETIFENSEETHKLRTSSLVNSA